MKYLDDSGEWDATLDSEGRFLQGVLVVPSIEYENARAEAQQKSMQEAAVPIELVPTFEELVAQASSFEELKALVAAKTA